MALHEGGLHSVLSCKTQTHRVNVIKSFLMEAGPEWHTCLALQPKCVLAPSRGFLWCTLSAGEILTYLELWNWGKSSNRCFQSSMMNRSSENLCEGISLHNAIMISIILWIEIWADLWLKCQCHEGKTLPWPPRIWINEIFRPWFSPPAAPWATWLS